MVKCSQEEQSCRCPSCSWHMLQTSEALPTLQIACQRRLHHNSGGFITMCTQQVYVPVGEDRYCYSLLCQQTSRVQALTSQPVSDVYPPPTPQPPTPFRCQPSFLCNSIKQHTLQANFSRLLCASAHDHTIVQCCFGVSHNSVWLHIRF